MAQLSLFGAKKKRATRKKAKAKAVKKWKPTKAQLAAAKKKGGIVLKKAKRSTGTSSLARDRKLNAMAPGKRLSRNGKVYYESRRNRSDKKGK